MPAQVNAAEFLDLVKRSGVVDEAKLRDYVKRQTERSAIPPEPAKVAGLLVRDAILTYFQAEQILQGKYKRFTIGKYKVLEKLGAGGMGQVFLCEHKFMRRRVAVKVLPTAKAEDTASLDRFYREARAVAAVDHPNIVRAYDIDQDENLHFLVMEYVDGTNLQDLIKKVGPLDPVRACHYVYGPSVGLQHAHEIGLIHRDIKPGNILIDRAGTVKILDMGLARFFHDEDDNLTRQNDENVLGTADYLAPEQAVDSHTVDIRADIYSLGATFYFLLTGRPPFAEGTVAQKLIWLQNRQPKHIRSLRPNVPDEIVAIVERMMMKDPAKRYQTPADVMASLSRWVATPIPPPSEREIPNLSPAAGGSRAPGDDGGRVSRGRAGRCADADLVRARSDHDAAAGEPARRQHALASGMGNARHRYAVAFAQRHRPPGPRAAAAAGAPPATDPQHSPGARPAEAGVGLCRGRRRRHRSDCWRVPCVLPPGAQTHRHGRPIGHLAPDRRFAPAAKTPWRRSATPSQRPGRAIPSQSRSPRLLRRNLLSIESVTRTSPSSPPCPMEGPPSSRPLAALR